MADNKLEREEIQRTVNFEALKSEVKSDVSSDIAARAETPAILENEEITLPSTFEQKRLMKLFKPTGRLNVQDC